jgi:hypothetical protein
MNREAYSRCHCSNVISSFIVGSFGLVHRITMSPIAKKKESTTATIATSLHEK